MKTLLSFLSIIAFATSTQMTVIDHNNEAITLTFDNEKKVQVCYVISKLYGHAGSSIKPATVRLRTEGPHSFILQSNDEINLQSHPWHPYPIVLKAFIVPITFTMPNGDRRDFHIYEYEVPFEEPIALTFLRHFHCDTEIYQVTHNGKRYSELETVDVSKVLETENFEFRITRTRQTIQRAEQMTFTARYKDQSKHIIVPVNETKLDIFILEQFGIYEPRKYAIMTHNRTAISDIIENGSEIVIVQKVLTEMVKVSFDMGRNLDVRLECDADSEKLFIGNKLLVNPRYTKEGEESLGVVEGRHNGYFLQSTPREWIDTQEETKYTDDYEYIFFGHAQPSAEIIACIEKIAHKKD